MSTTDPLAGANPEQRVLAQLPICPVIIVAPPGCGKTEALAYRAAGLIHQGAISPNRQILALTFSNKARDNLSGRMTKVLGRIRSRRVVTHNFHGFAARVVTSHRNLLPQISDFELPRRSWQREQFEALQLSWPERDDTQRVLREAKQRHFDDEAVAQAIEASQNDVAIEMERRRLVDTQLDFDDLIRYAVLLLGDERVRHAYSARFAAVLVDEMQDMTLHQLEIAMRLGCDRLTLAGDSAQGIYTFTGADAAAVSARFDKEEPVTVALTLNYRSAPAVLSLVNALSNWVGGAQVECADESAFPDEGHVRVTRFDNTFDEASAVLDMSQALVALEPSISIGVIARLNFRKAWAQAEALRRDVPFEAWDNSIDSHRVLAVVLEAARHTDDLEAHEAMCIALAPVDEIDLLEGVKEALALIADRVNGGELLADVVRSFRVRSSEAIAPGLHFLNAHVGKGQQFDWVMVLGLEEGVLPSHLAKSASELEEEQRVFHVMCSRARYGLVISASKDVRSNPDRQWLRDQSRWLRATEKYQTDEDRFIDALKS